MLVKAATVFGFAEYPPKSAAAISKLSANILSIPVFLRLKFEIEGDSIAKVPES
jgi:hypothetical protein